MPKTAVRCLPFGSDDFFFFFVMIAARYGSIVLLVPCLNGMVVKWLSPISSSRDKSDYYNNRKPLVLNFRVKVVS